MQKINRLLEKKCLCMVAEHFQFTANLSQFSRIWDLYVRNLASGDSFLVFQDPWDKRREIPISTEVATKALVLGGFP